MMNFEIKKGLIIFVLLIVLLSITQLIFAENNCPHEIYNEIDESIIKERYASGYKITLIDILCNKREGGLMVYVKFRSSINIPISGIFSDLDTIVEFAKKIFQSAFGFTQVVYVEIHFYNPYLDEFGNPYIKHEVTMSMDRELAEKVNWKHITGNILWSLLKKRELIKIVDGEEIQEK